jgi:hypothetical protein
LYTYNKEESSNIGLDLLFYEVDCMPSYPNAPTIFIPMLYVLYILLPLIIESLVVTVYVEEEGRSEAEDLT